MAVDEIIKKAKELSKESDLMIKKYDAWQVYIETNFNEKFTEIKYRYEYEKMYSNKVKSWLEKERTKFNKLWK